MMNTPKYGYKWRAVTMLRPKNYLFPCLIFLIICLYGCAPSVDTENLEQQEIENADEVEYFKVLEEYTFKGADWKWSIGQNLKGEDPIENAEYERWPADAPFYSATYIDVWKSDKLEVKAGIVTEGAIDPIIYMATESDGVSTFRNISVGDSTTDLTKAYPQDLYYDYSLDYVLPDYKTIGFQYDKAYVYVPKDHSNRHIQVFLYKDNIVRIEMADYLDDRLVIPEYIPAERPDVEAAYIKASEAYNWFNLSTMDTGDGTDTVEFEGHLYTKVTLENIKCMEDLRHYLSTLFSDELVSQLLRDNEEFQQYRDFNGQLYVIPADRGTDITKGEAKGKIMYESFTQVQYYVTVEVLDPEKDFAVIGKETHEFLYQGVGSFGDTRWVFTNFESIR